jgi:hypothetical protein
MSLFLGKNHNPRRTNRGRTHDIRGAHKITAIAVSALSLWLADVPRADACGGCFHQVTTMDPQQKESTVVTDHRMAFAISQQRTVLWDQIRYQGNPAEFVWALPVKPGTVVELSSDQWMGALDALTQPTILSPPHSSTYSYGGGGGGGCFSVGCGSASESALDGAGEANPGANSVQVVNEAVVGPYETVTLHSSNPNALENWLVSHGYEITAAVRPIVTAYVNEGFDFIALRLRPGESVSAMQPVRVISPGADVSLPLRMVAVGAGASVGITLFVVSEGRYQPQNFPNAQIDFTNLTWDFTQDRSNYQELSTAAMAQANGRSFITEYAQAGVVVPTGLGAYNGGTASGTLSALYYSNCEGVPPMGDVHATVMDGVDASMPDPGNATTTCPEAGTTTANDDGGADEASAGDNDGGLDDGAPSGTDDAGGVACSAAADGGAGNGSNGNNGGTSGSNGGSSSGDNAGFGSCGQLDDLVVATEGMDPSSIWVTRLRANLPVDSLAQDLKLEAAAPQLSVTSTHTATDPTAPAASIAPPTRRNNNAGSFLVAIGTALFLALRLRRREPRA